VWQKAKAMAVDVYRVSESLPKAEIYGLPLRCGALQCLSPPTSLKVKDVLQGEFTHFLGQARGSLLELETQLEIALDLGFVSESDFNKLCEQFSEVRRLLNGLIESIRASNK
jgi:23S rRNA-intervening sequence protein